MNKQKTKKNLAFVSLSMIFLMMVGMFSASSVLAEDSMQDRESNFETEKAQRMIVSSDVKPSVLPISAEPIQSLLETFFTGTGFLINKGESQGLFLELEVLSDGNVLFGGMVIEDKRYRLEGQFGESSTISDEPDVLANSISLPFDFRIFSTEDESLGTFSGEIKNFKTFKVIEGKLTFKNQVWELTAVTNNPFKRIVSGDESSTEVHLGEVILVANQGEDTIESDVVISGVTNVEELEQTQENYFRALEVKDEKFLGIFPTNKKILEFEIFTSDKVFKSKIKENSKMTVEGYEISVGSLDNTGEIEVFIA